jgi:hypothetical protein
VKKCADKLERPSERKEQIKTIFIFKKKEKIIIIFFVVFNQ